MKILGDDDLDACWGDLLQEELAEEKLEKPEETLDESVNKSTSPCSTIVVTDDELSKWAKPWRNSLIVKILGKKVSYRMLENKLRRSWLLNGDMRISDLAEDFYLVELSDIEDYRHALFEGPWKVVDHYLIVQRWRPFFSLNASITKKVAVWIRIPKLSVELCNDQLLGRIGATLGTMLRIVKLTSLYSRGKYARICVELDLDKPLASHINIRGYKLCLEYEGLHSICFSVANMATKKNTVAKCLKRINLQMWNQRM